MHAILLPLLFAGLLQPNHIASPVRTAYLSVVDDRNVPITGLGTSDIEVRQGGDRVAVQRLAAQPDAPEITIVADMFDQTDTERVKQALEDFVRQAPSGSRFGIVRISGEVAAPDAYGADRDTVRAMIGGLRHLSEAQLRNRFNAGGPWSVHSDHDPQTAVSALLSAFATRPAETRVLVMVATEQALSWGRLTPRHFQTAARLGVRIDVVRVRADLRSGMPPTVDDVGQLRVPGTGSRRILTSRLPPSKEASIGRCRLTPGWCALEGPDD
jgi:hypothetical protein